MHSLWAAIFMGFQEIPAENNKYNHAIINYNNERSAKFSTKTVWDKEPT